jgi:uncharacterized protein (DUF4415 family)
MDYQALSNMSIIELKQLLSCVNQDIKSIKRKENAAKKAAVNNAISELAECNIIAQRFTGKQYAKPVQNAKIIADIQIQKDILDYLNNGGHIITAKPRKQKRLTTFRNNKYSAYNMGAKCINLRNQGINANSGSK